MQAYNILAGAYKSNCILIALIRILFHFILSHCRLCAQCTEYMHGGGDTIKHIFFQLFSHQQAKSERELKANDFQVTLFRTMNCLQK